jgi:hypothetical protein
MGLPYEYGIGKMKSLYLAVLALATTLTPLSVQAAVGTTQKTSAVTSDDKAADYYGRRGHYRGEHRGRIIYGNGGHYNRGGYRSWDRGWHNDSRYDWRAHRNYNRSYYRPVRYYAPYRGHSYNRVNIGFHLGNGFYGQRYWINNPGYYRLPNAYGPYRWVRYYDDVYMIDTRNGYVADTIHNFYW